MKHVIEIIYTEQHKVTLDAPTREGALDLAADLFTDRPFYTMGTQDHKGDYDIPINQTDYTVKSDCNIQRNHNLLDQDKPFKYRWNPDGKRLILADFPIFHIDFDQDIFTIQLGYTPAIKSKTLDDPTNLTELKNILEAKAIKMNLLAQVLEYLKDDFKLIHMTFEDSDKPQPKLLSTLRLIPRNAISLRDTIAPTDK